MDLNGGVSGGAAERARGTEQKDAMVPYSLVMSCELRPPGRRSGDYK